MKIEFVGERDVFYVEIVYIKDVFLLAKDRLVVSFNKDWEKPVVDANTYLLANVMVMGLEIKFYYINTISYNQAIKMLIKNKFFCVK